MKNRISKKRNAAASVLIFTCLVLVVLLGCNPAYVNVSVIIAEHAFETAGSEKLWYLLEVSDGREYRVDASDRDGLRIPVKRSGTTVFAAYPLGERAFRPYGGAWDPTMNREVWLRSDRGTLAEAILAAAEVYPGCAEKLDWTNTVAALKDKYGNADAFDSVELAVDLANGELKRSGLKKGELHHFSGARLPNGTWIPEDYTYASDGENSAPAFDFYGERFSFVLKTEDPSDGRRLLVVWSDENESCSYLLRPISLSFD